MVCKLVLLILLLLILFGGVKIVFYPDYTTPTSTTYENHDESFSFGVNIPSTRKFPPEAVLRMLTDYRINKVKLLPEAAQQATLIPLSRTHVQVTVTIPNNQISHMAKSYDRAKDWVNHNLARYKYNGLVNIKYVAVGNGHGDSINATFLALENIQTALNESGFGDLIKATVPFNIDVCGSPKTNPVPSAGRFRSDIYPQVIRIVDFLYRNNAPFTVNIHPFLLLRANRSFPLDYAFFDGVSVPIVDDGAHYTNIFDASFDTLVSSLRAVGVGEMPIIVGEVGWPTGGEVYANVSLAQRFYEGLLSRLAANKGTPLRPGNMEVYMFELLDEDDKSVDQGSFEQHWGIFKSDGQPKFQTKYLRKM